MPSNPSEFSPILFPMNPEPVNLGKRGVVCAWEYVQQGLKEIKDVFEILRVAGAALRCHA
jgi:hypothetical protein